MTALKGQHHKTNFKLTQLGEESLTPTDCQFWLSFHLNKITRTNEYFLEPCKYLPFTAKNNRQN